MENDSKFLIWAGDDIRRVDSDRHLQRLAPRKYAQLNARREEVIEHVSDAKNKLVTIIDDLMEFVWEEIYIGGERWAQRKLEESERRMKMEESE